MAVVLTGQANILELPIVAKASGNPIIIGVVNFYLVDKDGLNAGKWYQGSDQTWKSARAIAGAATHRDDGHWYLSVPSDVWTKNIGYRLYAKESGDLHIPVGENVLCTEKSELTLHTYGEGAITVDYYLYTDEENETGPIADCKVWATTDLVGSNIVVSGYTNVLGKITFYLDAGIYYMWRKKTGYMFTNPDTEVVSA